VPGPPPPVLLGPTGPVRRITLNRPESRNAVSSELRSELVRALGEAAADPTCRTVVMAAAGPDFCAGADLAGLEAARRGEVLRYGSELEELLCAVEDHPQPVVAAVRGRALGLGCLLVLACDLAVAAGDAVFGIPSSRIGAPVPFEGLARVLRAAGPKRAAELLQAGREVSGDEAAAWGLVNEAVPATEAGRVEDAATALAERIAALAPLAVRASKRGLQLAARRFDRLAEGHLVADFDMMEADVFASDDLGEGIAAVRERRPPLFEGR
jgi:enoyl-CoA hydratase/carnithine racemase